MKPEYYINLLIEKSNDQAIRLAELDNAIIGINQNGLFVYDYSKIIDVFTKQGMSADDAGDYIDYNVLPINAGNGFSVVYT